MMTSDENISADAPGTNLPETAPETNEERPVYVAKRLSDAKRLEEILSAAGIEYEVEPDTYQGGVIFRTARVGAFFYVAPELRERAGTVMIENGFQPVQ